MQLRDHLPDHLQNHDAVWLSALHVVFFDGILRYLSDLPTGAQE
jgi:hypothetical protein